ncbi:hypothetical protein EPUL_001250 [Erysiphe pulchra]|uniref:Rho-GAP domain-containing protein n=1 Tax=Erysiphe pulchra TaxID=225359 RepID=A0A2S4PUC6_9PEZI|nr:hypothetical protein EPUL_001250 [Erysiphe pulchra]
MVPGTIFYDLHIPQRLMQSNTFEGQPDCNSFSEKKISVENGTESHYSIPRKSSIFSAKELLHRKLRSGDIWADSSSQTQNDLTDMAGRSDYFKYLEEYNTLAKKENLRSVSLRHESWFSRKILRRQSSPQSIKDKHLRHKKSLSDISLRISSRKDKFRGKNLQELGRLCGFSLLYLPTEYSPGSLLIPTCFRALAHYLVEHGTTTRGLFRVPGSHNTVNDLYNYFCNSYEQSKTVAGTVRSPTLPGHIKCDVYDIASTFKKFLIGLPGGIIGSSTLFDVFLSINIQLNSGPESIRTKLAHVRVRLIALAVLNLSSEFRRNLIYAVFGLLCMIGRAAEAMKSEEDQDRSIPTSDFMDYDSLGTIFGPIIIGDLIESYSMQIASPKAGLILLPISSPKSRKEKKRRSGKICDELKEVDLQMDKIEIANKITEMIITEWCDVVQHIKNLTSQNHEKSRKRPSTCSITQPILKSYVSKDSQKNSFQKNKPIPAGAKCSKTLPPVMKVLEPSTIDRSDSNDIAKQSSMLESFIIKGPPVEKSFYVPSSKFSEAPNKGLETRFRRRKLASSSSISDFSQSCSQITTSDKNRLQNFENSIFTTSLDKNFELKNSDMSFAYGAPKGDSYEDLVQNVYTPGKAESSINCNNATTLSKNRSYLPIPTERRLKRSNFRSKKLSLGQKSHQNQEKISTQEPVERFHDDLGLRPYVLSQNSVKYTPSYLFCVSDSDPNLKPPRKNRYAFDPLNDNLRYHSRILNSTENGSPVTTLQDKDISFSEKLSRALDQRSSDKLNLSHEAKYDNNITPDIYLCQNEDRIMKQKFDYTNQTDKPITPLGSVKSISHCRNKMSYLLAKFENDIYASPKLNEPTDSVNRSVQSGNRLLGEYTKNPPLETKKSIESDTTSQKAIPTYKYPIPDSEIIRFKDLDLRRSFINLKDTPSGPLRRVKSFIEKPIKNTTILSSGISRPLSVTNQINGQYIISSEFRRGVRKVLNNSSLSSCSKQEFTIQASSARKIVRSNTGTEDDGSSKFFNSAGTLAPGRSNPLLYDQVRNLQRQLDKKCEEVQKLKQQAGTWHDITVGTLKKNLEDSKRHAKYWQEKAKFFEMNFYSLHQALSTRNSHEQMYFSHKTDLSRSNSNLDNFSTTELAYRLLGPSQVDKWETKSWNSECSNGTVIRGLRKCVTESELNSWLK